MIHIEEIEGNKALRRFKLRDDGADIMYFNEAQAL
jgi:hypothetical protein